MIQSKEIGKQVKANPKNLMDILVKVPAGYLGKIISISPLTEPNNEERYLFATPHGSVFELGLEEMDELVYDELDELKKIEERASSEEKVLYGGQVAIDESNRIILKKSS